MTVVQKIPNIISLFVLFITAIGYGQDSVTFEEAILQGYARDGGLFVPENIPRVDSRILREWSKLSSGSKQ